MVWRIASGIWARALYMSAPAVAGDLVIGPDGASLASADSHGVPAVEAGAIGTWRSLLTLIHGDDDKSKDAR